jgi:Fe-S-cluster-containing dehydrogenase component
MSPRYAMTVDTRRCVGCNACVIACKEENALPPGGYRDWIATQTTGVFPHLAQEIRSERCNHCDHPPCVRVCPTGASHVGAGGTVLVSKSKCTGCSACVTSCPYDARYINPQGYADKCTFCVHRVKAGKEPACVASCPTQALRFGDLGDARSPVAQALRARQHKVLKPEAGTEPNVYFLT